MGGARYSVPAEIKETADAFYRAFSNRNLRAIMGQWAQTPYAAVAGPAGQLHHGYDEVCRYWEAKFQRLSGVGLNVRLTGAKCHAIGDVGWLSGIERRTFTSGDSTWQQELRVTCVLERRSSGWQIVSYHASRAAEHAQELAS
jgi:ketosteroid isomerase-like protein